MPDEVSQVETPPLSQSEESEESEREETLVQEMASELDRLKLISDAKLGFCRFGKVYGYS